MSRVSPKLTVNIIYLLVKTKEEDFRLRMLPWFINHRLKKESNKRTD